MEQHRRQPRTPRGKRIRASASKERWARLVAQAEDRAEILDKVDEKYEKTDLSLRG